MSIDKDTLVKNILKELNEANFAIFAGAGLSMSAGYVSWSVLLRPVAEELRLDIEKEQDLVSLAQYHINENGGSRSELNQRLIEEFTEQAAVTENHKILARLPIRTYWTTNYDKLIEKSLQEQSKRPDVKHTKNHLSLTLPRRDAVVYKMHGDVEHPDDAILTKDDYESYHIKMDLYLSALQGDLLTKTFLFLGFSFTDPNLDYILSRVRLAGRSAKRHYAILKRIKLDTDEAEADFKYRERKQELFIGDLKRFNIKTFLVDEYEEITNVLQEIEKQYKRKNIFISGAAHDYGEWGREKTEKFVHALSKKLISEKYKVVSGFGLGVGSAVISGALSEIYSNPNKYSKEDLILRPFPQDLKGKEYWTQNRKDLISYSGIAIFLYGNKLENGEVIQSNGMREEFEIAKENNLLLIPVGATGYISEDFYKELEVSYKDCELYKKLGDKALEPKQLIEAIINFLNEYK